MDLQCTEKDNSIQIQFRYPISSVPVNFTLLHPSAKKKSLDEKGWLVDGLVVAGKVFGSRQGMGRIPLLC